MRALVGLRQKISGKKRKSSDRIKRSRRSNAQVSLDNADAIIEGAQPLAFSGGRVRFYFRINMLGSDPTTGYQESRSAFFPPDAFPKQLPGQTLLTTSLSVPRARVAP
jgi:hypothetical protein